MSSREPTSKPRRFWKPHLEHSKELLQRLPLGNSFVYKVGGWGQRKASLAVDVQVPGHGRQTLPHLTCAPMRQSLGVLPTQTPPAAVSGSQAPTGSPTKVPEDKDHSLWAAESRAWLGSRGRHGALTEEKKEG